MAEATDRALLALSRDLAEARSEEQITENYEANLATRYTQPKEVEARHILIRVPRDADEAALEVARIEVQKALDAVTERAYALARNDAG